MAVLTDWAMKQHDTREAVEGTLAYSDGTVVALASGDTVKFLMRPVGSNSAKVNAAATKVDPTNGVVRYQWVTGDTDTKGQFNGEFEVTFADGRILTFPNTSYLTITVYEDLG